MKVATSLLGLFTAALVCSLNASAQEVLQVKFLAKCQTTNDSGKAINETINNKSILQEYADENGVTNLNSIDLVYEVNGDERGDVIEIVDASTGAVLSEVYGFFFPVDLPTTPDGSQFTRYAYLYNSQQSVSMGSAFLKEKIKSNKQGDSERSITGNLYFYLTPQGSNGLRLCTGTINAGKAFTLKTNTPAGTNAVPSNPRRL